MHIDVIGCLPPTEPGLRPQFLVKVVLAQIKRDHRHAVFTCVKGGTHPKKHYWGRHCWARGYVCATVGRMAEEMVQEYLAHHFEPDRLDNFRTES